MPYASSDSRDSSRSWKPFASGGGQVRVFSSHSRFRATETFSSRTPIPSKWRLSFCPSPVLNLSNNDYEAVTLDIYEAVMRRFLDHRTRIPPDDLVEVRYDDLDERPEETIRAIYQNIDPDRAEDAVARTAAHLEGREPYQKNRHSLGEAQLAAISERWGFAIDEWRFERPTT